MPEARRHGDPIEPQPPQRHATVHTPFHCTPMSHVSGLQSETARPRNRQMALHSCVQARNGRSSKQSMASSMCVGS
jgi:hypothetical protein